MNTTPIGAAELPEAIRLAEILEGDYCPDWFYEQGVDEVAAELRRQHALLNEQQRTIEALNACINGEGSTTTDNLRLVDRLHAENEALRAQPAGAATPAAPAQEPFAYAVYFPDQPCEELVHDLDELLDDMTNREHTITKLYDHPSPQPAVTAGAVDALDTELLELLQEIVKLHSERGSVLQVHIERIGEIMAQRAALAAQRATHQGDHK